MADARGQKRRAGLRLWLPALWLGALVLAALLAPWIAPKDPLAQDLFLGRLPPFWAGGAEPGYYLGTDSLGRDVLSRILHGARIALVVALVAGTLTCLIGASLGLLAGFLRGWTDLVISRLIDIWMAMDYVASAQVAGRGRISTMLVEILPNVLPTIVVLLTLEMGIAVIVEAILSFVNLSISTDDPTWGGMIAEGRTSIHQAWWVIVFPLITLFLTVLSFSQLGEGLKDRFDPVLR